MRLILVALALLACSTVSAEETPEQRFTMPDHNGYMEACMEDYAKQFPNARTNDDVALQLGLFCQCEYEKLPPQGEAVDMDIVDQVSNTCRKEIQVDEDAFHERYLRAMLIDLEE